MRKLVYSDDAKADLVSIAEYIADSSGSRRTATRFVASLKARCRRLARLDQIMGRQRPELSEGLRSVPEGRYIIFFRYIDSTMVVVNVIEGHRDLDALFNDDDDP